MKELIIISGKGGTGKTSLAAAFASLAGNKVLCDADVDAADLHLIMDPKVKKQSDFRSGFTADIDKERCTECGLFQIVKAKGSRFSYQKNEVGILH